MIPSGLDNDIVVVAVVVMRVPMRRRMRVLAVAVMAAMRVAIEEWLESEHPGELARLIGEALDLLGEGFAPT